MSILVRVLSAGQKRKIRQLQGLVSVANSFEPKLTPLSDAELRAKTDEYRKRYADGEDLDDLLPEAFASVREAAKRTIGQRPFDVQLMGGITLHHGKIAEMRTGEGKTLVATLPVYLNALAGHNVHVVTVNDYLAKRDSEWMGAVYRHLGLSVGAIQNQMRPSERRPIYEGDIVYGTNSEFGFDYLRDNMAWVKEDQVQRGHHYAIVDEVDSILIDEARTPLIISGAAEESAQWYYQFARIAKQLQAERDYEVDEAKRTTGVTEEGVHRVEQLLNIDNLYNMQQAPLVHYLETAIKAKELYKRDKDYVVTPDNEVIIVDEFTGRMMPGRRWSDGIHQAVEAKEGVRIREEQQTLATITIQNYFRMYEKLAGMTGTAKTEAQEFEHIYQLEVVEIPTNQPMIRDDRNDLVYKTEEAKYHAIVADIKERHEKGQPVLIGTTSIEKNERLSRLLDRQGLPHELLNAKAHEREASIIAQAGRPGAITVATNMAGRGVDIILGGNPEFEAKQEATIKGLELETEEFESFVRDWIAVRRPEWEAEHKKVLDLGGLHVVGTERHESRRIDNQLRGRSGRQGDPGETRFYLALDDDLMRLFAGDRLARIMERLRLPDEVPIEAKMVSRSIERAQSNVEQQNFEIRKNVLKYDDVLNTQRQVTYRERTQILEGEDLTEHALKMVEDVVLATVEQFASADVYEEDRDIPGLLNSLQELYPTKLKRDDLEGHTYEEMQEAVLRDLQEAYKAKEAELGSETMRKAEGYVLLNVLDAAWRDHLYEMDYLREGIGLRAMAQRDPLVEYQREGFDLFSALLGRVREEFTKYIFHVSATVDEQQQTKRPAGSLHYTAPAKTSDAEAAQKRATTLPPQTAAPSMEAGPTQAQQATGDNGGDADAIVYETIRREGDKVGRNDPCPCGSGKKYKRCHGTAA